MKTQNKILLDRVLGLPLVFVFNLLARLLGWLLRRDHSIRSENVRTIVVAKFLGLGSILQSTPFLRALRTRFPGARLIFVTTAAGRELFKHLDAVDEVLCMDDRGPLALAWTSARTLATLAWRRVDLYFDLEVYSAYACLMALLSLARNRLGFYRYSARFKRGIYTHLIYFNARRPIRYLYLQLGRLAGAEPCEPDTLGPLKVSPGDREHLREKLAALAGAAAVEPYVVFNPNASDLLLERRWPLDQGAAFLELLARGGRTAVLIGAPGETDFVAALVERLSPEARARVVNTAGQLTLGELFALLEGAACVVTNDTGPLHMALALSRPLVALFGPVDPGHYSIERPGVVTLYSPVFCSPCVHEMDQPPCAGNNVCMKSISPAAVAEAVQRLADGLVAGPPATAEPAVRFTDAAGDPLGRVVRAGACASLPPRVRGGSARGSERLPGASP